MFKEVRGSGLLVGVQFTDSGSFGESVGEERVVSHHRWQKATCSELVPPLVVTKEQIDKAVEIICRASVESDGLAAVKEMFVRLLCRVFVL